MSAADHVDHAGYERHALLGQRVRDVASGGEGELMAVTHEVHDGGRVVRVAHIRPASGVEWSTAVGNLRPCVGSAGIGERRARLAAVPRAVVMQPTTQCLPMDCTYCYLPLRKKKHLMPVEVATAVAASANAWAVDDPAFEVVWHGGEPLAAGRAHLAALMDPFEGVKHSVQTNAVLVDDAWCGFLAEHGVAVGVSIDGPEDMNTRRVTLAGRPGFRPAMRGIDRLRRHGIPFSAIAVVSDPDPADAARFYGFFAELGATALGVNVEEEEGVNRAVHRPDAVRAAEFWAALADAWRAAPVVRLREVQRVANFAGAVLQGRATTPLPASVPWDPLPTVAYDGGVVMLSPELAGFTDDRFGDFTTGNVLDVGLGVLVAEAEERTPWITEFWAGMDACRATCPYFAFCGGGHPANRYFEHRGRMDGTRTRYCTTAKIALLEGVTRHVRAHAHWRSRPRDGLAPGIPASPGGRGDVPPRGVRQPAHLGQPHSGVRQPSHLGQLEQEVLARADTTKDTKKRSTAMATRVFGHVTVTSPDLDEPGLYLSTVETLDSARGMVQDFAYGGVDLRSLALADTRLVTGRIAGLRSQRVEFEALNLHGVEVTGSDLGSVRWSEGKLSRVVFRDCKLMGAALDGLTLDDVLFEGCKFDYATFDRVRATGPLAFAGCTFTEAVFSDCDLTDAVFSDCALQLTEFGVGRYRDTDLRGNDLSAIRGIAHLSRIRIDHTQPAELAHALVGELGISVGDD